MFIHNIMIIIIHSLLFNYEYQDINYHNENPALKY